MRKRVYIAAPISKGDLLANIRQADAAFFALVSAGFAPLNPVLSVFGGAGTERVGYNGVVFSIARAIHSISWSTWIEIAQPWVAASDAVLRLPGESEGADREVAHAQSLGIPVFVYIDRLITHFAETPHV